MDVTVSTSESDKTEFILPEVSSVEVPAATIKTEKVDCAVFSSPKVIKQEVVPEKTFIEIKKEPETVYLVPATSVMNIVTGTTTASTALKAVSTNVVLKSNNTVSVMTSPRNELKTIQAIMKAPGTNPAGPVITKVIIANNPVPAHSRSQSICLAPIQSIATASSSNTSTTAAAMGQQVKIVTAPPPTMLSPTKTISLNQATLLASPNKMILVPGTPPKQGVVKLAISPNTKTPTKIMIPVSIAKSPQRIAPAPASSAATAISLVTNTTSTTNGNKLAVAVSSPQKVILRPTNPVSTILKPGTTLIGQPPVTAVAVSTPTTMTTATTVKPLVVPISNAASLQPIQVPGSKFQYLRLVTTSVGNSSGTKPTTVVPVTTGKPVIPASLATTLQPQSSQKPPQVKIAVPIAPVGQPAVVAKQVPQQRILIPASSVANVGQLRAGSNITVSPNLASLPPGTALISTSGNLPGLVMVPAQYVTQFQQQFNPQSSSSVQANTSTTVGSSAPQPILPAQALSQGGFVPIAAAAAAAAAAASTTASASLESSHPSPASRHQLNGRSPIESNGIRPRKPCNCTKSQCLKLYCDCFATGEFCNNCNCNNCSNNLEHEEERQKAIKACLDRNPQAFHPKIGKAKDGDHERRHNKGCNCKRSGCLKNYCECYEAKIMCSNMCKCVGCKNFEESAERKTLMHLADAAEVRVQQQTAAKNKFSSQVQDVPSKPATGTVSGERLPFTFITPEVVQATCQCLLAQAEEGEKSGFSEEVLEKLVLEEFGRCLLHIIKCANRTKTKNSGVVDGSGSTTRSSRNCSNT